jgi:hypothetical protein
MDLAEDQSKNHAASFLLTGQEGKLFSHVLEVPSVRTPSQRFAGENSCEILI